MAEPIYLTKQDYYDFSGIDLALELQGANTDNPSDIVDIFLERLENWCLDYLFMKFGVSTTHLLMKMTTQYLMWQHLKKAYYIKLIT